jgi:hypothetical protein
MPLTRKIRDTPPFTHPSFEIDSLDVPLDCSTFKIVQYRYQDYEPEFTSDVQKMVPADYLYRTGWSA